MGYLLLHTGQSTAKRLLKRIIKLAGVESMDPITRQDQVIRWGNTMGSDSDLNDVINPREAILLTRSRNEMLSILKLNGVRCPYSTESGKERSIPFIRHYRVPVFNMRALSLFRADGKTIWLDRRISQINEKFREVESDEDKVAIRVARYAIHAVHALGLDFGLVSLGVSSNGLVHVLDVSPTPVLKGKILDLYVDAIEDWIQDDSSPTSYSFLMGTDLEFMLRSGDGKMVFASKYFPRTGKVGCDALSIRRAGRNFPLAEIRPEPSNSPLRLVQNIESALLEAKKLAPKNLQWLAGSMPFRNYSIGGHIHFSFLPISSQLVKALDNYLALPVFMLEDAATSSRRRPKYGFLGDIRLKSHGGWEYRTLGSWMVSPSIATSILCLANLVATHYRELKRTPLSKPDLQHAFYSGNKKTLFPYFEEIWRDIQRTDLYEKYKEYLNLIYEMAWNGESWNEMTDIKRAWGIRYGKAARTGKSART